jgi:hypothetical protein
LNGDDGNVRLKLTIFVEMGDENLMNMVSS